MNIKYLNTGAHLVQLFFLDPQNTRIPRSGSCGIRGKYVSEIARILFFVRLLQITFCFFFIRFRPLQSYVKYYRVTIYCAGMDAYTRTIRLYRDLVFNEGIRRRTVFVTKIIIYYRCLVHRAKLIVA